MNAFMCAMSCGLIQDGMVPANPDESFDPFQGDVGTGNKAFRVIETLDSHSDIIHLFFRPLYLFPSWTTPRDFCLLRYWRLDDDGSYVICFDSVVHPDCRKSDSHVRGEMHAVYTIAPRREGETAQNFDVGIETSSSQGSYSTPGTRHPMTPGSEIAECLLTQIVQVNPRGWVPTSGGSRVRGYAEAFGVEALNHILDIRDTLDNERFVNVGVESAAHPQSPSPTPNNRGAFDDQEDDSEARDETDIDVGIESDASLSDFASPGEAKKRAKNNITIENFPPPLPKKFWDDANCASFNVRGKTYKSDKKKIKANKKPLFRFFACDMVESDAPLMKGLCGHPTQRVMQALQREKEGVEGACPPFVVCVNIALPGPPFYHAVFYYAVDDMKLIDGSDGSAFGKLAQPFFFGESDEFR